MSRFDAAWAAALDGARAHHHYRSLRPLTPAGRGQVRREGRILLNVSGNDYLGLAADPRLSQRAQAWAEAWGTGSGASRLVTGTFELHQALEARLARFKGTEAALIFTSGWQANASLLPALASREALGAEPLVFTDRLNHASLHHGCQAAGIRQLRFRHNDLDHLESLLKTHEGRSGARFIVTESVFSMDGDRADVPALAALAERYGAFLYLDEAHATGVLGPQGRGLASEAPGGVDLIMGTFGKALGSFGAYVAGSRVLCDYLINRCSGFIYATALPPSVLGATDAALELVPTLEAERCHLQAMAGRVRAALHGLGIDTGASSTQIVPALIGDAAATLAVAAALEQAGILAAAIRPPTVPQGTSRLRLALSAVHGEAEIDALIGVLTRAIRP